MRTSSLMRRVGLIAAVALASAVSSPRTTYAAKLPLWELGLGASALALADYRGANTAHLYPLPFPYFVYRGEFLRADDEGLKGKLLVLDRVDLNISLSATPPVRGNATRQGMPDLRPTVEIGPSLDLHVWRSTDERVKLDVRLPARAAVTIEWPPRRIGWVFAPHVNIDIHDVVGRPGWKLGLLAGPLFADARYHGYFYTVDPKFATAERPAYEAHGGYSGAQMLASLSKRYPAYWIGAYVRYDALAGAAFTPSPLVKRESYWSAGIGIAWMIRQSSRLVDAEE